MYRRNRKHLMKTEHNEDQIMKLSDDDEVKIVYAKSEEVKSK